MPSLIHDGELLFYEHCDHGKDRNVIFIHGSGGDHSLWPEDVLSIAGGNIYNIDLPGHGDSTGKGCGSISDYAEVISSFVQTLSMERVILCGHSLGSAIALECAIRRPYWLEGIVLVGSGARLKVLPLTFEILEKDIDTAADLISKGLLSSNAPKEFFAHIINSVKKNGTAVTKSDLLACNSFDVMSKLGEIQYPALIITGSRDIMTPVKYAEYLHAHIPGSELVIIPDAGHLVACEKSGEFLQAINTYIKRFS